MRIFKTKWFARYARRERIEDESLCDAVERIESGLVDADLGCGLIKQRIAKAGKGRSGGYRVLIAYRFADIAIFIYGFSKNEKDNIEQDELASFQEIAGNFLKYKDESIQNAIKSGFLYEVNKYGKEKKQSND